MDSQGQEVFRPGTGWPAENAGGEWCRNGHQNLNRASRLSSLPVRKLTLLTHFQKSIILIWKLWQKQLKLVTMQPNCKLFTRVCARWNNASCWLKGAVSDCNAITFLSNTANISSRSSSTEGRVVIWLAVELKSTTFLLELVTTPLSVIF